MPSLLTTGRRFNTPFQRIDGLEFYGTIQPVEEGSLPSTDIVNSRLLLRVPREVIVNTKDVIVDAFGRHFLLCDHNETFNYRVHRLVLLNEQVSWKRAAVVIDPVTTLQKSSGTTTLGNIWMAMEPIRHQQIDLTIRITEEVKRFITGSSVLLGDLLNNKKVRQVDFTLGVWVGECQ